MAEGIESDQRRKEPARTPAVRGKVKSPTRNDGAWGTRGGVRIATRGGGVRLGGGARLTAIVNDEKSRQGRRRYGGKVKSPTRYNGAWGTRPRVDKLLLPDYVTA